MLKKIKTITSHAGHARFLGELDEEPIGYIPRTDNIPSPYSYSTTQAVWSYEGKPIVIYETSHKRYEVFAVPADRKIYTTDAEAHAAYMFVKGDRYDA